MFPDNVQKKEINKWNRTGMKKQSEQIKKKRLTKLKCHIMYRNDDEMLILNGQKWRWTKINIEAPQTPRPQSHRWGIKKKTAKKKKEVDDENTWHDD